MVSEGLGQLEAYIDAEEGAAFEMDNGLIWDSLGQCNCCLIQGDPVKKNSSKFWINTMFPGKVVLKTWDGMFLSVFSERANANPVLFIDKSSLQFEVFYRNNKIALQACNGLFFARVYRCCHAIEAARDVADDTCLFRPMIGDINTPTFKIREMNVGDFPALNHCIIKTKRFINRRDVPENRSFTMTWVKTVTDRITWNRQWGLGIPVSHQFRIHGMKVSLKYTEDNEKDVSVRRNIYESQRVEVVVPSKSICTVRLFARKSHNVILPFKAIIHKVKYNGDVVTLREKGTWSGFLYHSIQLGVKIEQYSD